MYKNDHESLGIVLVIFSGLLFAMMVIMVKAVSKDVPLGEIVFFRSFFALIPLVLFLYVRSELPSGLYSQRPWGHVFRSLFGLMAMFASFAAVARLPIAEATLISYLSPMLLAIAGVIFLGERGTIFRMGGIAFGLAGVTVLVWSELDGGAIDTQRFTGLMLGIISAVLAALALSLTRSLARDGESPGAIAFYFAFTSMLGGLATLLGGWVMPDMQTMIFLVLAGLFGGFAHIAMTLAFRYAEASRLAPFEYLALFWPALADLFIFETAFSTAFILAVPLILMGAFCASIEKKIDKHN